MKKGTPFALIESLRKARAEGLHRSCRRLL